MKTGIDIPIYLNYCLIPMEGEGEALRHGPPLAVFLKMPRQFSKNDIVRLLLNVERSVVREALTDERLADHEVWLKKEEILTAIAKIHAEEPESVDLFTVEIALDFLISGLEGLLRAREVFANQPGIINRLISALSAPIVVIFEAWIAFLQELSPPEPPPAEDEFDLTPERPPGPPPSDIADAISALVEQGREISIVERFIIRARSTAGSLGFQLADLGTALENLRDVGALRARALRDLQ